jgi:hypothetical protein
MLYLLVLASQVPSATLVCLFTTLIDCAPNVFDEWLRENFNDKVAFSQI